MEQPVYAAVRPIWVAFSARKIGSIPAGSQITNLWDYRRDSTKFSDWLANNSLTRRDIVLRRGWLARISNATVYGPAYIY